MKPGGSLLINCPWDAEELAQHLPAKAKREIATKGIRLYTIDAIKIARELGLVVTIEPLQRGLGLLGAVVGQGLGLLGSVGAEAGRERLAILHFNQ